MYKRIIAIACFSVAVSVCGVTAAGDTAPAAGESVPQAPAPMSEAAAEPVVPAAPETTSVPASGTSAPVDGTATPAPAPASVPVEEAPKVEPPAKEKIEIGVPLVEESLPAYTADLKVLVKRAEERREAIKKELAGKKIAKP